MSAGRPGDDPGALPGGRSRGQAEDLGGERMRVVAIGAHPDDIELGCGGTLLAHRAAGDDVTMLVMTAGDIGPQGTVDRRQEQAEAAALLGARLVWGGFDDGAVPDGVDAVSVIQRVVADADVVYTHSVHDTHQDHRATARASFAAARRVARVLSYESPSSVDFEPALFFDVDGHVEHKLELVRAHLSQVLGCGLVDLEAVEAQARFRGFQARAQHAEAFEVHRFLWRRRVATPGATPVEVLGLADVDGPDGVGDPERPPVQEVP
jgi:LmbE family N-acetylglucosaminyl deacetylase